MYQSSNFASFFNQSQSARVVVVGDIILDCYQHGAVSRVSPEAPVPVMRHERTTYTLGGAGNVASNIVALGGEVELICLGGEDERFELLRGVCADSGVNPSGIFASSERDTTVKTRFISTGQQLLRHDFECAHPISEREFTLLIGRFEESLSSADLVVLSDYGKGVITKRLAQEIITLAKGRGIGVIVDPKGDEYEKYRGATTITPNLSELSQSVGRALFSDEEVTTGARELIEQFDIEFIVATRSENGMSVVEADTVAHLPTKALEVYDVSGAGDTVVASLAVGLAKGLETTQAAHVANVAAGIAVAKYGTAQVSATELLGALDQAPHADGSLGVLSVDQAVRAIEAWRREGIRVGFSNGCFDILHAGHVKMLKDARSRCDKLIVGLNSDDSIRRLKGPDRPINLVEDRADVLAGLRAVDAVVVFEQDTPLALIETFAPDVLFKGADYRIEDVVGADFVTSRGGHVELLELATGRSTTNLIEKIKL